MECVEKMYTMEKSLISIIVPVYNAGRFLKTCLESLVVQSYRNIEIVVINDGSTDNSEQICSEMKKADPRISYYYQQNQGVSAARNHGIQTARGEYIIFVDADDCIKENAVEQLYEALKNTDADGACCGYVVDGSIERGNDTEGLKFLREQYGNKVDSQTMIQSIVCIEPQKSISGYAVRNIYKAEILNQKNIRFDSKIKIAEDYKFILNYLAYTKTIAIVPEELYIYRTNEFSTTAHYIPTIHEDMNAVNQWMRTELAEIIGEQLENYSEVASNTYRLFVQNLCLQGTTYTLSERIKLAYKTKREVGYRTLLHKAVRNMNNAKNTRIAFTAFCMELEWLFIILYSIKQKTINI